MTIQRRLTIVNALGLHARAAARFVKVASEFQSRITVTARGTRTVDGKSILGLLLLAAARGGKSRSLPRDPTSRRPLKH